MDKLRKIVRKIIAENLKPPVVYSGVIIEDPIEIEKINKLINQYVPINQGWRKPHNYHMTIKLGTLPQGLYLRGDLNKEVTLTLKSIGISANAIAVETFGYYSVNDIPHITLAFHKHSEPAASKNINNWTEIEPVKVTGIIREVGEGNNIIK